MIDDPDSDSSFDSGSDVSDDLAYESDFWQEKNNFHWFILFYL